ncbi:hypothetical protein RJ640_016081 [Escallonia rubra]|uniref:DUF7792 domain-containing protein n=1 Tax=Escallonia rubra TaxID=112253 RepID=A0AA88R6I2_9ASTE|nr:hypothetical protein RJ640_016081 [Escallonia rubra]
MASEEKRIEDVLSHPIMLAELIRKAVDDADWFKLECSEAFKLVDRLSAMLRSAVRFANAGPFYERPIRRIAADITKNLGRALTLVQKCRRRSILRRVMTIVSAADFRKLFSLLEASIGDMTWLISIYDNDGGGGIAISLPPIATNDPILSWVWSFIASLHLGQLNDRIEAANEIYTVAKDNDRNKKIIVEEGGISPLLKLLKESGSPEAQIAAANALYVLSDDQDTVKLIGDELGVPIVVSVLGNSPIRVQIIVARLVARMAGKHAAVQEDFGKENVIRPLVTLLSFDTIVDDPRLQYAKKSINSIVQINKQLDRNSLTSFNYKPGSSLWFHTEGSSRGGLRKERENETPEMKHKLKTSCTEALWMLARGSVSNGRRITETKGLLCLANLIEGENGELQKNCLMTVMEIAAAAESNADLRRAAFKTNSPAAKAVVDQLLRVIKEYDSSVLQIPAIRSIGSLARTFPARQTHIICPLVEQLSHRNQDVAMEATISLEKFACPENFLCVEHSKAIIEFNGIPPLMRLLRGNEWTQLHALFLLSYLALHAGHSEALEQARVLVALEGADRTAAAQNPELRELISKAIYHLNMYRAGYTS